MGPGIRSAPRTTWGQAQHERRRAWIGVWKRINIGVWLLWVVVLTIALLQSRGGRHPERPGMGRAEPDERRVVARPVASRGWSCRDSLPEVASGL
jgi:hypothetical protein